jgi:hypothetical protein
MGYINHRLMLDRGRKAGLRTSELYGALASARPDSSQGNPGTADVNGFLTYYDGQGQRTYKQWNEPPKS